MTAAQLAAVTEREQGRLSALAGRPIYANPYLGAQAEAWFAGYREVPDDARGSQPELRAAFLSTRTHKLAKTPRGKSIDVKAATPRPWVEGAAL